MQYLLAFKQYFLLKIVENFIYKTNNEVIKLTVTELTTCFLTY